MINRGSEWRLWNLHMHSTYSKESRTKMTVKEIFDKLIENNISMFSITDHSNVDALDEIWDIYENQENENGLYKNQIDFIPGIELKTDKGKKGVHLICVFPQKIKIGESYIKSTKQNIYDNFCSVLGLAESKITANGEGDYGKGLLKSVVKFDDAVELTHKLGGLVIIHGGDKHGSIEEEMKNVPKKEPTPEEIYETLDITKNEIIAKKIDIIELPNYKKQQARNAKFYSDTFGKPCMVASDSHERSDYENMQERCTWVKADCSFEGLRQALIDYDNRMFLGVIPEQIDRIKKNPTKYIDKLVIDWTDNYDGDKGKWFQNICIPMNPGLISIIGNKGNGKSAIAEIIGLLADSQKIKESKMLDFYNYLFGLGYLTNKYELVSDNKTLDKLSPGERGALLLIFYLLLDLRDIPLVIDQPEDNLDNQSVAKVLVPFIQAAKNRRQIILVTHNPNLAVVADSDQIIHVKIDKENEQLVEVEAGGIEDDIINDSIVTILEGTMFSFKKRELKYIEG